MTEARRERRYLLYVSQIYSLAVLRPLQDAIRDAGGEAAWFFDGPGADYLRDGERKLDDVDEVQRFDPAAVFVPGNWVPGFFPGAKVEVFHGFSVGKRSDMRGHFRIRGLFDLYCTQGSTTTPTFLRLASEHGHFHVAETGWPKTDPLFRRDAEVGTWKSGWQHDRPLILYASTFTRALSSAPLLCDSIRELSESGRWNWLVTLHPKMPEEVVRCYKGLQGPHLKFAETDDVVPLLKAADVMVSDTSSIVYEFLLLHKPVVTLGNTRPGPHLIDISEPAQLADAIDLALRRPADLLSEIAAFSHAIHPYRDGKCSERVLQATEEFIDRYRPTLGPKPINLWRRLRMRRKLGYYRPG